MYYIDHVNDPDVMSIIGASSSLMISDIPFKEPIAAVRVGRIDGSFIINPTIKQRTISDIDIVVSGSRSSVLMVEGSTKFLDEYEVLDAIWMAHNELKQLIDIISRHYG